HRCRGALDGANPLRAEVALRRGLEAAVSARQATLVAGLLALGPGLLACERISFFGGAAAKSSAPAPIATALPGRAPAPVVPIANAPASFADLAAAADPAVVFVKTVQRGHAGHRAVIGAGTG